MMCVNYSVQCCKDIHVVMSEFPKVGVLLLRLFLHSVLMYYFLPAVEVNRDNSMNCHFIKICSMHVYNLVFYSFIGHHGNSKIMRIYAIMFMLCWCKLLPKVLEP